MWYQRGGVDADHLVEGRALVSGERAPVRDRLIPHVGVRGVIAPPQVFERGLIGGDEPCTCTCFDAHVANRHPAFHRKGSDSGAPVLDHVADATAGADLPDDCQHDVLGSDAVGDVTFDLDGHRLRRVLRQRLRGEHVLHFTGPNAEGERAERAVGRCVAVAAHDGHTWLGQTLLGPDHVHDALVLVPHGIAGDAELLAVRVEDSQLGGADRISDWLVDVSRGDVVVSRGDRQLWVTDLAALEAKPIEGLRGCDLVDEVEVDEEKVGLLDPSVDDVVIPDLLCQGAGRAHEPILTISTDKVPPGAS